MVRQASTRGTNVFGLRLLAEPRVQRSIAWTLLAILVVVRGAQFLVWTTQVQWGYDFQAYWGAARNVLDGLPIYAPYQLDGPYPPQGIPGLYLYPPFLAVAVTPLAAIFSDYRVANWVWAAMGAAGLIAISVGVARRDVRLSRASDLVLLVGAAFVFAPVVGELVLGNVHLVILTLLGGAWLGLRRASPRGDVVAGSLVGVAALIKVFPGLVIVWFLLTGRTRAAVASIVTMLALAAATVPIVGLEPWLQYPTVLLNLGSPVDLTDVLAPTVWLSTLLPAALARVLVTGAGLVIVLWATRSRSMAVSYSLAVAISILIAPALYQHYLAVLVLPLLLAIAYAPPLAWVAVAYVLMSGGEQEALGSLVWVINRLLPTIGALLVAGGLAWFGRRATRDTVVTPTGESP